MKLIKSIVFTLVIGFTLVSYAQDPQAKNETTTDKKTYYQKRAIEDANYEQQFSTESKAEEEAFWKEQKNYEKDLKKKDRKAHRAYTKEKKRAYVIHYEHCDHHCHHSDFYYSHASFYYYRNDRYPQRSRTINTGVSIRTPSIRLGIGIL